jgi:hypothetical protein
VLHEYVFLETVTVLLARRGPDLATRFGQALLDARDVDLVFASDHFAAAWETFRDESHRGLSFTDGALVSLLRGASHRSKPNTTTREEAPEPLAIATFDQGFRNLEGIATVPA